MTFDMALILTLTTAIRRLVVGLPEGLLCSPLPGPARSQLRQGLGVEEGHQGEFTPNPITGSSFNSAFLVLPPQAKPTLSPTLPTF